MEQHLLEAVSDGVATLTLNRPERLNALSTPIMEGLLEARQSAEPASCDSLPSAPSDSVSA